MTDTSTTASAPASTSNLDTIVANIKSALSADGQKVVAFFEQLEQDTATVLGKISAGVEIAIEDIETLCENINSKLGLINAGISATSAVAASVAPGNTALQKLISDVSQGVQDAAAVSTTLSSGSAAGDNTTVTTAVTTLNSVNTLAQLGAQASTLLGQAAAASPSAMQAVSPPTPEQG